MPVSPKKYVKRSGLYLRGSTYHVRIDVPEDLRAAYGHRLTLSKSLKTGEKRLATELASSQIGVWKAEFRAERDEHLKNRVTPDVWQAEAARMAANLRAQVETLLPDVVRRVINNPADEVIEHGIAGVKSLWQHHDVLSKVHKHLEILERNHTEEASPIPLRLAMGEEGMDRLNILLDILDETLPVLHASHYGLRKDERLQAAVIIADPSKYRPKSPITKSSLAKFEEYYATQNEDARTRRKYISNIQKLSKWLTSEGKELNFDSVAEFLASISDKRSTRLGYLASFRAYHEWASLYEPYYREHFFEKSPFDKHKLPKTGDSASEEREHYTDEQVEQLYTAAIEDNKQELADLILFACYSGARIEEIGHINIASTVFDEAEEPIAFKVPKSKTTAGERTVPIHSKLLPIYKRRLNITHGPNRYLFPGNDATKGGSRLNALSQQFSKLKKKLGFNNKHVFHSFRNTLINKLENAGIAESTTKLIVGHKRNDITYGKYSKSIELSNLSIALEAVDYNFSNSIGLI